MIEILKSLIGFTANPDTVIITTKWMILWPIIIMSAYVHYRAVKSFIK